MPLAKNKWRRSIAVLLCALLILANLLLRAKDSPSTIRRLSLY